jgi:hypothetical protein
VIADNRLVWLAAWIAVRLFRGDGRKWATLLYCAAHVVTSALVWWLITRLEDLRLPRYLKVS